jgi:cellulose biosynthesis protein BcsQ
MKHKGHITTIANQKGGVGKTTTAHALITGLVYKGYKALAVDIDPQSNLTFPYNRNLRIYQVRNFAVLIYHHRHKNIRHRQHRLFIPNK